MSVRMAVAICSTVLTACASGSGDRPAPAPETRTSVTVSGAFGNLGNTPTFTEPGVGSRVVPAAVDSVWEVLPRVYEQLGIPEPGEDRARMTFGSQAFRARRVEGERLSRYIDCGMGPTAVPNADSYQVALTVLTTLSRAGDGGTEVTTMVDANARPRAVAGNPIHCQSKGVLEMRVAQLVLWMLVEPGRRE